MDEVAVLEVGREALFVILKVSGPIMIAGLGIGLLIALFQALTTIQELTLTFVPKIILIFVAIILTLPFMMTTIVEFANGLFERIATLG
ncbi:MAG TPA: flagellar biosynthesis protein FliQ [Rhodospirillales bacterium]|nr:flagellar biosynthesis protein FliQ [Rhodospirillales bacterium]